MKIAKKNKIDVIEDACMGIGGKIFNQSPGTFGKVNAFSMHPLKSLNVMGDGGGVSTNNKNIAEWIKKYRNHGMVDRDHIDFWGVNIRMQPLQAIVAIEGLKKIDQIIKIRNRNAKILDAGLRKNHPNIIIPIRETINLETFSLYMILCKKRDKLKNYLVKKGIEVKIHYPIPLHLQKASKNLNYKKGQLPVSEYQAKHLITLPVHQYLTVKQLKYMIKVINDFYK